MVPFWLKEVIEQSNLKLVYTSLFPYKKKPNMYLQQSVSFIISYHLLLEYFKEYFLWIAIMNLKPIFGPQFDPWVMVWPNVPSTLYMEFKKLIFKAVWFWKWVFIKQSTKLSFFLNYPILEGGKSLHMNKLEKILCVRFGQQWQTIANIFNWPKLLT